MPPGEGVRAAIADALAGGPAVAPLDSTAPTTIIRAWLDALRPTMIVTEDGTSAPELPGIPVASQVAAVITTSGSTGAPKCVELSASALITSAQSTLSYVDGCATDGWLCCLPTNYIAGFQVIVRALVAEAPLEIVTAFEPQVLADSRASFVSLVPTMVRRAIADRIDLSNFRRVLVGGAAVPPEIGAGIRNLGSEAIATYGMSETAGGCVYDGNRLPEVAVRLDESDRIVISGPTLAQGYRLNAELTASSFVDDSFITADLGRWLPDGRLAVLGRIDDVINTGGVKVAAPAIEQALVSHQNVSAAAVVGIPDPEWGQQVVAVITSTGRTPTLAELRAHITAQLGAPSAPRTVIPVPDLPLLPNGKINRVAIRKIATGYQESNAREGFRP